MGFKHYTLCFDILPWLGYWSGNLLLGVLYMPRFMSFIMGGLWFGKFWYWGGYPPYWSGVGPPPIILLGVEYPCWCGGKFWWPYGSCGGPPMWPWGIMAGGWFPYLFGGKVESWGAGACGCNGVEDWGVGWRWGGGVGVGVTDCTGFGESNLQHSKLWMNMLSWSHVKKNNCSYDFIIYFLDKLKLKWNYLSGLLKWFSPKGKFLPDDKEGVLILEADPWEWSPSWELFPW